MTPALDLKEAMAAFQSGDLYRALEIAEREVASAPWPLSQHFPHRL